LETEIMRDLLLTACFAAAALACSTEPTSRVAEFPSAAPSIPFLPTIDWSTAELVTFSHDARPADGNLVEIILKRTADGRFDATKHVVTAGFGGPVQNTTEELASGLTCQYSRTGTVGTYRSSRCSRDMRPLDGPLVELLFAVGAEGKYAARLVITPSGFGTGDTTPRVTELGAGFEMSVAREAGPSSGSPDQPITCMAYWMGWEYDATADACVERGASGCTSPFEFRTQEACEAASRSSWAQ
jgi:hypothetical protein